MALKVIDNRKKEMNSELTLGDLHHGDVFCFKSSPHSDCETPRIFDFADKDGKHYYVKCQESRTPKTCMSWNEPHHNVILLNAHLVIED